MSIKMDIDDPALPVPGHMIFVWDPPASMPWHVPGPGEEFPEWTV